MTRSHYAAPGILVFLLTACAVTASADAQDDAITLARQVADERMDLSENAIKFVQAEAREWPDTSLGCPEKGMQYLQVITPGYAVKLITQEKTVDVHVAGKNAVICGPAVDTPRRPVATRDLSIVNLIRMARDDFARRLGDSGQEIRIAGVTPTEWPDASLGCPETGADYAQVATPGYLINLEAGNRSAAYHADSERIVFCEK